VFSKLKVDEGVLAIDAIFPKAAFGLLSVK
jgi:hypothetical protein